MRSLPAAPPAGGPTFRASSSRGERCVQTGWYGFAKDVSEPLLVASERVRRVNPERSAYDLYGDPGTAQGVELTPDSGYFWFFDPANVELTLKVLNACSLNNKFWVFLSGLTDVEVTVTVTDTRTGTVKIYTNPQGQTFKTVLDTGAFGTCP